VSRDQGPAVMHLIAVCDIVISTDVFVGGSAVVQGSSGGSNAAQQALLAAQLANKQIQCKEFNVGKCFKGSACPFMHKDRVTIPAYS